LIHQFASTKLKADSLVHCSTRLQARLTAQRRQLTLLPALRYVVVELQRYLLLARRRITSHASVSTRRRARHTAPRPQLTVPPVLRYVSLLSTFIFIFCRCCLTEPRCILSIVLADVSRIQSNVTTVLPNKSSLQPHISPGESRTDSEAVNSTSLEDDAA
jgi:hypothetical protein